LQHLARRRVGGAEEELAIALGLAMVVGGRRDERPPLGQLAIELHRLIPMNASVRCPSSCTSGLRVASKPCSSRRRSQVARGNSPAVCWSWSARTLPSASRKRNAKCSVCEVAPAAGGRVHIR